MAGQMPVANFPGIRRPSIDFQDVRDGRRSTPFYVDVDLSTARTIAAGTQLMLPIAGNSFYCDPVIDSSGNPIGGVAVVHFQDTTLNPQGTPFTVAPQFIANVPFTQVLIENPAQTGKRLRIVYGVDIDFRPGINAQVSISGIVAMADYGYQPGAYYAVAAALAAATNEQVIAPAANLNGVLLYDAAMVGTTAAGSYDTTLLAKSSAPGSYVDGDLILSGEGASLAGASDYRWAAMNRARRLPSGRGLYFRSNGIQTAGLRRAAYTIL